MLRLPHNRRASGDCHPATGIVFHTNFTEFCFNVQAPFPVANAGAFRRFSVNLNRSSTMSLIERAENLPYHPPIPLMGRAGLLDTIKGHLLPNKAVLMYGAAGVGK